MIRNNNLTVINPFVTRNFFRVLDTIRDKSKTLREQFEEFVEANQGTVDSINEMLMNGDYDLIKETYGYNVDYMKSEPVNEIKLPPVGGGSRKTKVEDGFAETDKAWDDDDEDGYDEDGNRTANPDDEYRAGPSDDSYFGGGVGDGKSNVIERDPSLSLDDETYVKNLSKDSKNMMDLHYCCRVIYYQLLPEHVEKDEETGDDIQYPNRRDASECEYTLLDTSDCTTMDALFAFFDVPNIDLSTWDVSHVANFEGMFYKSTFNNLSIRYWDVTSMTNHKNMFAYCPLSDKRAIESWNPKRGGRPILGDYVDDVIAKRRSDVKVAKKRFGSNQEEMAAKIKSRKERLKTMGYTENRNYVMSSEQFINEGLRDTLKKVASKIKGWFKAIYIKTKEGIALLFDRDGNRYNANPIDNVKAYIENYNIAGAYFNQIPEKSGEYEEIKKGSLEYQNFLEFCRYFKNGGGGKGGRVSEARVTLASGSGTHDVKDVNDTQVKANIGASDINTKKLERVIKAAVNFKQSHPKSDDYTTPVIWGAPGIGKTRIIKDTVRAMSDKSKKLAVIVADCSQMPVDGFNLPTPVKNMQVTDYLKNRKNAQRIAAENGLSDEELDSIPFAKSDDAPKTWLPVYRPTGVPEKDRVLNAIANSYVYPVYNDDNEIVEYRVSEDGGVLFLDEFLRAKKQIFFAVCQLMNDYTFGEYVLGDKWQIIAASNRPSDDREVQKNFAEASAAGFSRLEHWNFIPSMDDWCKWAKDHRFDEVTIAFIRSNGADTENSRFHNFDPDLQRSNNEPRMVSPRSWTKLVSEYCKRLELDDKLDDPNHPDFRLLGKAEMLEVAKSILPDNVAKEYVEYYMNFSDSIENNYNYSDIMNDPNIKIADKDKEEGGTFTVNSMIDYLKGQIAAKYDSNNWVPKDELEKCMKFLCNNYKSGANIIYTNFLKVVVDDICHIPEEDSEWYLPAWNVFANAFPSLARKYQEED